MVYAFTSASNNNGSAFGGLTGNTDWFNTTLGLSMLGGRFLLIVAALALAGALARKQSTPATAGTFPTGTPLFAGLLVAVVVIVVGLTYFPVLALGPILEHLNAMQLDSSTPRFSLRPSLESVWKLDPRRMVRNPVMFVVEIGSVLVTVLFVKDPSVFAGLIAAWLWFTVLFANFAEAMAEGRGKAQAETLRKTRAATVAHRRRARRRDRGRRRARPCAPATRSSSRRARSSPPTAT